MLPENEFHAAPIPDAPKPNNSKWYSTDDVLGLTKMSRFTLIRKTKEENFPRPIKVAHGKNMYAKKEVDHWINEHQDFIKARDPNRQVTLTFTAREYAQIKRHAHSLECNMETFIKEAATYKANTMTRASRSRYYEDAFMI